MTLDDKVLARGFGVQSFSSSSQNTPDQKDDSYDVQIGEEILQQNYKSTLKQDLLHTCVDKERKFSSSNCKIAYQHVKTKSMKGCRIQESKRTLTHIQMVSTKQQRKGINPIRHQPPTESSPDADSPNNWICKNSACRAVLTLDDIFCKRCSCCICHLFDDNKDPSLWLVCSCEFGEVDSCGLSCHLECALQQQKVGVVDLGQLMQLDGSYCCASCGKISGILGCWKKQLVMAKDARRVDVLCYRISLCYRLLEGTSRFKELHEIVVDAKAKLETEVGPVNGVSAKMARGIVSRLSVAGDVQKLCSLAIEKADEWLDTIANAPDLVDSHPAACRFQFEELTSSSLVIVLKKPSSASSDAIKGYKLWYCKSRNESHAKEPICVFPKAQRRILISNLQPCTEYNFRIVSYSEAGDLGHSEAKCFTKSVEILRKQTESTEEFNPKICVYGGSNTKKDPKFTEAVGSSDFKVRDLGKILRIAWAQEEACFDDFCSADGEEECCGRNSAGAPETTYEDHPPYVANNFDLNVASVPDLNAEVIPLEYSRDDIECTSDQHEDDVVSNGTEKKHIMTSNGSDDSQTWLVKQIKGLPTVESRSGLCRKRISSNEEAYGCDSVLMNASSLRLSSGRNHLDGSYEYCVKIIRWLECKGHIQQEFRMKFLTWFSLRSTEQERKVVNTFIQTLIDDPSSLAGQLVDSFLDIISGKRLRSGFCSKLWH